jgi:hypothetical protein
LFLHYKDLLEALSPFRKNISVKDIFPTN